jgi:hypothetical protein
MVIATSIQAVKKKETPLALLHVKGGKRLVKEIQPR